MKFLVFYGLIGLLVEIGAAVVQWPADYSVEYIVEDITKKLRVVAKVYLSAAEDAFRMDLYGGETFLIVNRDPKLGTYLHRVYRPETYGTVINDMHCLSYSSGKYRQPLINLDIFRQIDNITVAGVPVQTWTFEEQTIEGLLKITFDVASDTKGLIPVARKSDLIKGVSDEKFLESQHIIINYYNYVPEKPDKSVFEGLKDVKCQFIGEDHTGQLSESFFSHNSLILDPTHKMKRHRGLKVRSPSRKSMRSFPYSEEEVQIMAADLPGSFDWRLHGAVTQVKDQMQCGSCWAFGTVGAMESAYFLKTGQLVVMSEQALMDCDWEKDPLDENQSNGGCGGGDPVIAFDWIHEKGGLPLTAEYGSYKEVNVKCRLNSSKLVAPIKEYVHVPQNEEAVKVALYHHGPLTVSISTPEEFEHYENGVMKVSNADVVDHSVLLIGYGTLNGENFWTIKNSWGEGWGLRGYALISRDNNTLHVLDSALYPALA